MKSKYLKNEKRLVKIKMKKVLILINSVGGLYNFRRELVHRLLEEGYDVTISAPYFENVAYFENIGCTFVETKIDRRGKNPISDLKLLLKYIKIIKDLKPTTVLTYTVKPNVYGGVACRILQIPLIANVTGLGTAVDNKGFLQDLTLFLYKISFKKAKHIFFQNKENQMFFLDNKVIKNNYSLLPGSGVNLNYFSPLNYPKDGTINFFFIGRVMKEKGIDQYLEAAEFIKLKYPNTAFHILGNCDKSYIEKIKELEKRDLLKYYGRQEDVREFHKFSHCTIHPSYYPEGMSNVLLESAASGKPLITTGRPGCKEIVNEGINGYIFEEKNSQDLIKKIEKFINMDYEAKKKMGLAGRLKVEKEFDRNIVIDAYISEMQS